MNARTDIHRPAEIVPADYFSIGWLYIGPDPFLTMACTGERQAIAALMNENGYRWSHHEHGGTCGVCGNVQAQTLVVFVHRPTGEVIRVGETCAMKMDMNDQGLFKNAKTKLGALQKAKAGKLKAQAILDGLGIGRAWDWYDGDRFEILGDLGEPQWTAGARPDQGNLDAGDDQTEAWASYVAKCNAYEQAEREFYRAQRDWEAKMHRDLGKAYGDARYSISTLGDMISKLVKYGSWSDGQNRFAVSLWERLSTFKRRLPQLKAEAAERAAVKAQIKIETGRYEIIGKVVSTRVEEGDWGTQIKMLIKRDDGAKLWGTAPRVLLDTAPQEVSAKTGNYELPYEALKGWMVRFTATVKLGRDPGFAIFSRPAKASLIDSEEKAVA